MNLVPGMVVARPVFGGPGNRMTLHIAVGGAITADTIAQFVNKGIECVAVYQDAPIESAARADAEKRYEQRLAEIFGTQPNEACQQLKCALQAEGLATC